MVLNSRKLKFLKNYRNVNVKSSAKRKYRDENVFLLTFVYNSFQYRRWKLIKTDFSNLYDFYDSKGLKYKFGLVRKLFG